MGALLSGLRRKLAGQSAPVTEEELIVALEREHLEQQQRCQKAPSSSGSGQKEGLEEGEEGAVEKVRSGESGSRSEAPRSPSSAQCQQGGVSGGVFVGSAGSGVAGCAGLKALRRQIAAARVRLEEKNVLTEAIAALELSLGELQSAVSEGGVDSFCPLDSSGSSSSRQS